MASKGMWVPSWLILDDLLGQLVFEQPKDLALERFGLQEWGQEALAPGLREAMDLDSEVEYTSE